MKTSEVVGGCYNTDKIGPHYSGNFWWSKEYIRDLNTIEKDYFGPEKWILSKSKMFTIIKSNNEKNDEIIYETLSN